MINQLQILLRDNISKLVDLTYKVTDIDDAGISLSLTSAKELFIGSTFPFLSIYFGLGTAVNTTVAAMTPSIWNGSEFVDFPRYDDGTASALNATLNKSGIVRFVSKDTIAPSRANSNNVDGIEVDGWYDYYWTRFKFDATLTSVDLKFIGVLFVESDEELYRFYPILRDQKYRTLYAGSSSKTTWLDERIIASDLVCSEIIKRGKVQSPFQFIDPRTLKEAAIHRTAELIFRGLGGNKKDDVEMARKAFMSAIEVQMNTVSYRPNNLNTADIRVRSDSRFIR
jgi:hypothetical protein